MKPLSNPSFALCLRPSFNHGSRRAFAANSSRQLPERGEGPTPKAPSNPLLDNYLKRKPAGPPRLARGDLAPSSIFEQDRQRREGEPSAPSTTPTGEDDGSPKRVHDPAALAAVLDPDPSSRLRWERKKTIRSIRHRGRIPRTLMLKRTERESLSKSHFFKTSIKKLSPLARQIAGKSIEDAISQMRFSRKKVSQDVGEHLEAARNRAIVARGMGLGEAEGTKGEPVVIETKEGKRKVVEDRTGIYIDQAWVGRGPYGQGLDYRARGRIHLLRLPTTSLSVVLKEEATRVRQHEERQEKRRNRKLWVQLPDRPVTAQHPYYTW
ncbi:MAG: hypothetical protein Q9165_007451 [Trypethelium subeluteriae]